MCGNHLGHDGVVEVDRYGNPPGIGRIVGPERVHPALRRKDDAIDSPRRECIVQAWQAAQHIGGIVVPAQDAVRVEIKNLLGAVAGNAVRKTHPEPLPGLAVFVPGLDFLAFHRGHRKQERRGQAGPHRLPGKVGEVRVVPLRFTCVAREGCARL